MYVNPLRNQVVLNDGSTGSLYVGVVLADGKTLGQTDGKAPARAAEQLAYDLAQLLDQRARAPEPALHVVTRAT